MKKLVVCLLAVTMVLCMSFAVVSVSAADSDFAPSIEVKPVPEISANEGVGAVINNGDASENIALDDMFYVSYNDAKDQISAGTAGDNTDACNALIEAYEELKSEGVEKSVADIEKFVTENLKIENPEYFVSHVFELNIGAANAGKLDGDASVTVKFDNTDIKAEAGKLVVTHMVDGEWVIVPKDNVKVTAETVEVTFDDLCPVAFLHVEEGEKTPAPTPDDDDDDNADAGLLTATIIILSITAVIILGIVVFYFLEKKGIIGNAPQNKSKKK